MAPGCEASEIDINTPTGTLTIVLSLSIFGRLHILDDKIQRESWSLLSCHINQIYIRPDSPQYGLDSQHEHASVPELVDEIGSTPYSVRQLRATLENAPESCSGYE
jgi:hypothetical protein